MLKKHVWKHFPHCILEVLVPHAVDEGVHCWRHYRVQKCNDQVQGWRGNGGGLQVGKYASANEEGDHSQVRETRGKGFVPALLRGHLQHCPEDLHIGHHNVNKTTKD